VIEFSSGIGDRGARSEAADLSVPGAFERQVARGPGRVAVRSRRHTVTYDGLNRSANRIARGILASGIPETDPVALLLGNDVPMVAAMLGTLKSGHLYVPLDPVFPRARLASILEDSHASVLVTDGLHQELAVSLAGAARRLIDIDQLDPSLSSDNPARPIPPDSPTWILYTSGSTGSPKGVVQTHRNVLAFIRHYVGRFGIGASDRLTLLSSCGVNLGAHDIFGALLTGASLHLYDLKTEGVGPLAHWLGQERITIYTSVPTVFRHFVDTLTEADAFPDLRLIKLGGEPVRRGDVERYRRHFGSGCLFVNRLGMTETGSVCWSVLDHATPIDGPGVPVGHPVEDHELLLLDDAGRRVGADEIGEIAVRSRYLSPGYWGKPELTQATFLPDPEGGDRRIYRTGDLGRWLADGRLAHLGRKDSQVKIRGHRVEIDEVEVALGELEAIRDTAVVAREDPSGEPRLVAYVVPRSPPAPTVTGLRHALAERLPTHMIPTAFVYLDALPVAPNGKVYRRALPAPDDARPELDVPFVGPRTPVEGALARIWAEVLGLKRVGIHDEFLDLGGHSLLAGRIAARVVDAFQADVPLSALLAAPTVESMAVVITIHLALTRDQADAERMVAEVEALSEEQARVGPADDAP
jgi:amino acid adenylation domain-containing protein